MFYTDTINHTFYGLSQKHCDEQQHLTKQFTNKNTQKKTSVVNQINKHSIHMIYPNKFFSKMIWSISQESNFFIIIFCLAVKPKNLKK